MSDLRECPFCGCQLYEGDTSGSVGSAIPFTIKCPDCPARMVFHSSTIEQAVAAWNRRAQPAPGAEAMDDTRRLDWLEKNLFAGEMDSFDRMTRSDSHVWNLYAPKGVQGSARRIIDAAIAAHSGKGE